MTRTRRLAAAYIALAAAVAVLFVLNLFWGSVSLAPGAVLTALLLWVAALCVSLYDYHQAYNGWSETSIIEEPSPYGQ